MEIIRLLESQERSTFNGAYYRLDNAPFEPKPVNGHMPILIGTAGKRMLRHVARYADIWDVDNPAKYAEENTRLLHAYCAEIGRDPSEIRKAVTVYSGRQPLESVDAFREHVTSYARVGVRSFLFNTPTGALPPLFIELAERVIPELRQQFAAGELV
jgi:alkanesulfonate monooxygenase SsuD/methylene tetrahydromethanopterin reductase-like flavin-dependent oxidoreductase (luciferase family)